MSQLMTSNCTFLQSMEGQGTALSPPLENVDPMSLARLWGRALAGLHLKRHMYDYPDTLAGLFPVSLLTSGICGHP